VANEEEANNEDGIIEDSQDSDFQWSMFSLSQGLSRRYFLWFLGPSDCWVDEELGSWDSGIRVAYLCDGFGIVVTKFDGVILVVFLGDQI